MICNLCPRNCNIDRKSQKGYCLSPETVRIARADLHMWEEPCISGEEGSGTIFFSGCNLRCVYCQNREISGGRRGKDIPVEELASIMLSLEEKKANNINLVTPSHYIYQIASAIKIARKEGLNIPIVYNTSSYEKVSSLKQLEGLVDVYLPDFKYYDDVVAVKYSRADNYRTIASEAIDEMLRQCGQIQFDDRGIIAKGVIVRHLVLPSHVGDSKKVIEYLYNRYGDKVFISIMNQYTPLTGLVDYPEINRRVTRREYEKVVSYAIDIGIENGFIQEGDTAKESFIPDFDFK